MYGVVESVRRGVGSAWSGSCTRTTERNVHDTSLLAQHILSGEYSIDGSSFLHNMHTNKQTKMTNFSREIFAWNLLLCSKINVFTLVVVIFCKTLKMCRYRFNEDLFLAQFYCNPGISYQAPVNIRSREPWIWDPASCLPWGLVKTTHVA